ncbi:helix-turn-helix domain-containing protein [Jatrophihabitans telluris]|uniref:Helix-turn-helix domain-containing protein n=1 Tax=Jatrophihabitans telluris TaxID=2038343 RepID=A0ABY4QUX9_9ACTN|nr:helix-turn-helix domain-containing protein [Jatrophihabitans telluris]UQX87103.1 helix-turn-helix domain-containing protein [Jatrophihabitans telluris]
MALILDTRAFARPDRADVVRETIASAVVHVDIEFASERGAADVYGTIADLGAMRLCSVRSDALKVERTAKLAGDDTAPRIFLALQMEGSSLIVQGGRETVLHAGELAYSESSAPYSLLDDGGIRQHFFAIPVAALALPQDAISSLSATTLAPNDPLTDLTANYLGRIAARGEIFAHPRADSIGQPSIDLVRALLATHLDASTPARDSMYGTLALRVLEYTRAHLHEPDLRASYIAAAHNISVRQLYNVMTEAHISLGDWIREHRLEECRLELGRPQSRHLEVARIGRSWGFRDPSTFGRAFKAAYGVTPGEWRRLHSYRGPKPRDKQG